MKRAKKTLLKVVLLSIFLLIINPVATMVSGVSYAGIVTLEADRSLIYEGEEFVVNVTMETFNFEGIMSFEALKEYDMDVVQYLGSIVYASGSIDQDTELYDDTTNSNGKIRILNQEGYHNDELIIQLRFKALEATGPEGTIISLKNMSALGTKLQSISYDNNNTLPNTTLNIKIAVPPEPPEVMPFSCRIDYENQRLVIDRGSNNMFFLSQITTNGKVKSYEIYEAKSSLLKIDLSKYSTSKEWKFILYGDEDVQPIEINLEKAVNRLRASYDPLGSSVDDRIIITAGEDEIYLDDMEVRTLKGKWEPAEDLTEEQLDVYAVSGTTLVFRIKAIEDESPYSSEVKLKIPKRAAGPKVTIDYSKLTIKFPKNIEYRIKHTDIWKSILHGTISIDQLTDIKTHDLYLEVRTTETEKKPASKFVITTVEKQVPPPVIGEGEADLRIISIKEDEMTTSVSLANISQEYDIEYALVDPSVDIDTINLASQKWKKILKGTEVILKKKDSDGKVVIARYTAITTKNSIPRFASLIGKSDIITW